MVTSVFVFFSFLLFFLFVFSNQGKISSCNIGNYIWLLNFLVNPSRTAIDQYCHNIFICMCIYIYIYICVCVCVFIYLYVCAYIYIYIYIFVCMFLYGYVYVYFFSIFLCVCIPTYVSNHNEKFCNVKIFYLIFFIVGELFT